MQRLCESLFFIGTQHHATEMQLRGDDIGVDHIPQLHEEIDLHPVAGWHPVQVHRLTNVG